MLPHSLAVRHVLPRSVDAFELVWTLFGYADDAPALREQRLLQANLVGPSGFISLEDVEALEVVQRGIQGAGTQTAFEGLGGEAVRYGEPVPDLVNEAALRGFWRTWRGLMGV